MTGDRDGPTVVARRMPDGLDDQLQLSERVAVYLREAIMVGDLRAPEYIRTERLAAQLGVSATPVREALMILHSEGAVRWEPRRGYRVLPVSARDVADLFAVQAFIAGELAARASQVLTGDDLRRIRRTHAELEAALADGETERVERLNHEIHRAINRAAGIGRLTSLLNLTVHYVPRNYYGRVEGWSQASADDHARIFDALERADADAARRAMVEHVEHIGALLTTHLERVQAFDPPDGRRPGHGGP